MVVIAKKWRTSIVYLYYNQDTVVPKGYFDPPSPLRYAPSFLSREDSSYFFPRRLASNCSSRLICWDVGDAIVSIHPLPCTLYLCIFFLAVHVSFFALAFPLLLSCVLRLTCTPPRTCLWTAVSILGFLLYSSFNI